MGVSARRRRYQLWTRSEGAPQAGQATRSAGARAVTRMVRSWRSICSSHTLVKFGNIVSRRSLHAQHHSSDVPADHRITECVPDPIFSTLYNQAHRAQELKNCDGLEANGAEVSGPLPEGVDSELFFRQEQLGGAAVQEGKGQQPSNDPQSEVHKVLLPMRIQVQS